MTEATLFYTAYAIATVLFVGLLHLQFVARFISGLVARLFTLTLMVMLLIPAAVPETGSIAPAWAIALFEWALGRPEAVGVAMRPIAYGLVLIYAAVFISKLALRHHQCE